MQVGWDDLARTVQGMVRPKRWQHTVGVIATAQALATRFGADVERARLAALVHDAAREWESARLAEMARLHPDPPDELELGCSELLHGAAAAGWLSVAFANRDRSVLDAVRYHTTGRPGAGPLEMVLVVADYSEPSRSFPEAAAIRRAVEDGLVEAYRMSLDARLRHVIDTALPIHPRTVDARNWALRSRRRGKCDD